MEPPGDGKSVNLFFFPLRLSQGQPRSNGTFSKASQIRSSWASMACNHMEISLLTTSLIQHLTPGPAWSLLVWSLPSTVWHDWICKPLCTFSALLCGNISTSNLLPSQCISKRSGNGLQCTASHHDRHRGFHPWLTALQPAIRSGGVDFMV